MKTDAHGPPRRAAGRPAELRGGKRVNVYLDRESLDAAAQLGAGNVSAGIRRALRRSTTPRHTP